MRWAPGAPTCAVPARLCGPLVTPLSPLESEQVGSAQARNPLPAPARLCPAAPAFRTCGATREDLRRGRGGLSPLVTELPSLSLRSTSFTCVHPTILRLFPLFRGLASVNAILGASAQVPGALHQIFSRTPFWSISLTMLCECHALGKLSDQLCIPGTEPRLPLHFHCWLPRHWVAAVL